jgi:DNA-binding CsgD family transcriptional regulator/tetratricopeptide (TPR) repeat protein
VGAPLLARHLVGRDHEVAALREAWTSGGTARLVRGPAGIGKSRLARELAAWAVGQGGTVLVGRASAAARGAPLRPIEEALLGAARRGLAPGPELAPFRPALAALVPEWADGPRTRRDDRTTATESRLVLGEAVLRLLVSVSRGRTVTLVIEDLQWADPETVAVVEYLADNVAGTPVLLLATQRVGESGTGTELAASLVQRRAAVAVDLVPLTTTEVLEVAAACLGVDGELPAEATADLVARSEGIPFLVEELVATAVGAGWETVAAAVPGSVIASVELRLEALEASARRLLVAAALLGRSFDWTIAARAADLDDDQASPHLLAAVRAQLVDVEGAGFRFRHALTRDAVLTATPPAEQAVLARRALEALLGGAPGDGLGGDALLVAAELAERAGLPAEAAGLLLDAARRALATGALQSAERFATRAREAATGALADEIDQLLLRVRVLAGHTAAATALGRELLRRRGDDVGAAGEVHLLLGAAGLAAGRWADAEQHADAAIALDPSDVARRARSRALAAQAAMSRWDADAAAASARSALDDATATGQVEVQCEALEVLGRAERGRDLAAAELAFQRAYDIADRAGLALWRVRALQELGTVDLFDSLDVDRLEEARREAIALGALATVAVIDLQLAAVHDERGQFDQALAAACRCEEASRRWHLSTLPMSLALQAMVHARRVERAEMERVIAAARATGEDRDYVEVSVWGQSYGIFHLATGDLDAADAAFGQAMAVVRRQPGMTAPVPGLWALVRTLRDADGTGGSDAARAEVASLPFDTPVSRRMLLAADAVALGRAGDPTGARARMAEAEDGLLRHGGGFRLPFVRLLVAPAAHGDGWGEPEAWLRSSIAAFEAMGANAFASRGRAALRDLGAAVPRRSRVAETVAVPPMLARLGVTAREVDVLALVAAGASNREVAERLVISPRTVDKHVERLRQKTGTTRQGLVAIAREADLLRT